MEDPDLSSELGPPLDDRTCQKLALGFLTARRCTDEGRSEALWEALNEALVACTGHRESAFAALLEGVSLLLDDVLTIMSDRYVTETPQQILQVLALTLNNEDT